MYTAPLAGESSPSYLMSLTTPTTRGSPGIRNMAGIRVIVRPTAS